MTPTQLAALHARAMEVPGAWSEKDFEGLLAAPGVFLVTPSHGVTTGFALGRVTLDEAELLTLAIDPEARRQGLGRDCLASFELEAAARGALSAYLEVAETNAAARALYRAAGWRETGVRRGYYRASGGRVDAILMSKPLAVPDRAIP